MNFRPISRPLLGAALLVPALGTTIFQNWPGGGAPAQALYAATKLFTFVLPLAFVRWEKPVCPSGKSLSLGALLGLVISGAIFALFASPFGDTIRAAAPSVLSKVTELGIAEHFVAFAIIISLFHTGLEEFYWRGLVFTGLRQYTSAPKAHAIAGIGFALHHIAILDQFFLLHHAIWMSAAVGIGGVLWSLLAARDRSLLSPWLSHIIVDVALMIIGYNLIF
ncbi:CPBP family intramembrane metalloprotease [Verrucomicrobiales bacterium]|nr:CPBP family intramembrane metalloprotease [Verrucomicrobiales bacterium]